jgi:hypothetical protein
LRLYKTLVGPKLTYGSEAWTTAMEGMNTLIIFKKTSVWKINGHIKEGDHWRIIKNKEINYVERMQSQQTVTAAMGGTRKWRRPCKTLGGQGWRRFKYNGNKNRTSNCQRPSGMEEDCIRSQDLQWTVVLEEEEEEEEKTNEKHSVPLSMLIRIL